MSKTKTKASKLKISEVESKTSTKDSKYKKDLKQVQDHYLDYPYPHRDPEDDKKRLMKVYGDYLGEISHWLFEGKKDFKKGFRCMVSGGGTGDSIVYLAEQLKDTDAEVVYLDFSKTSMEVAKERAKNRGLTNITWINDSILNIPDLKLGKFDYIQCSGVLHHLENPDAGFKCLSDSLTDDGGINIMVYAKYGRTGVYQIQDLLRMANEGITSRQEEVKNAWDIVNILPKTNWYLRGEDLLADHKYYGDIGMYDMFLHKQDRCYDIPELYDFVKKAGLNFVEHNSSHSRVMLKLDTYITNPNLLARLKKMPKICQEAMAEIICGSIIKHQFYASKKKDPIAKLTNLDNVPYVYTISNIPKQVSDYLRINKHLIGGTMKFSWKSDFLGDVSLNIPVSEYTEHLFRNMIGDSKSLKEIFKGIESDMGHKVKESDLVTEINKIFPVMIESGALLLRNKDASIEPMMAT